MTIDVSSEVRPEPTGAHDAELVRLVVPAEPWMAGALCAQTDPEAFFPERGGSNRDAKAICARCDVRAQCLEYALRTGERDGIWGGLSPRQRRALAARGVAA